MAGFRGGRLARGHCRRIAGRPCAVLCWPQPRGRTAQRQPLPSMSSGSAGQRKSSPAPAAAGQRLHCRCASASRSAVMHRRLRAARSAASEPCSAQWLRGCARNSGARQNRGSQLGLVGESARGCAGRSGASSIQSETRYRAQPARRAGRSFPQQQMNSGASGAVEGTSCGVKPGWLSGGRSGQAAAFVDVAASDFCAVPGRRRFPAATRQPRRRGRVLAPQQQRQRRSLRAGCPGRTQGRPLHERRVTSRARRSGRTAR